MYAHISISILHTLCDLSETLPEGMDLEKIITSEVGGDLSESKNIKVDETENEKDMNNYRKIKCDMIVRQCTQVFKYLDKS